MIRKVLLACGLLAALIYVGSDIVAALRWEGYSYTAQSVSELRAIDAPTRPFLLPMLTVYMLLEFAFGMGVWLSAGHKRSLQVTGALLIALGVVDMLARFFPMHLRESIAADGNTFTDTMHIVLTTVTVLLILLIIGFGAAADGMAFRIYSYATIVFVLAAGAWAGAEGAQLAAGEPTPWLGIIERINIYGYMLWLAVLSVVLLSAKTTPSTGEISGQPPAAQASLRPSG
jgi:hypothetical protein